MTSPVDTTVKWARSTMPGAPVLTRAAGSLIALLDALLVNGWGVQTATSVVVAGGVATATFATDHAAARHAVVQVAGVTGSLAGLNGEQKITAVEPNKIKWATTEADGTAAGTITVKMAGAGWTKPFSGTNLAAYKSASPAAHGQFLRVADTTAEYARAVGYENMTAISTGTGLFPTSAQVSGGYYWGKNDETSGTNAVPWVFASDGRFFYLFAQACIYSSGGGARSFTPMSFGDLVPESPSGDPYATVVTGAADASWQGTGPSYVYAYHTGDAYVATPRARSGAGTASRGATVSEMNLDNNVGSPPLLPNPVNGAIPMGRVIYKDTTSEFPRATFPGLYWSPAIYVERVTDHGTILDMPNGKSMLGLFAGNGINDGSGYKGAFIDLIGPWR